MLVKKRLIKIGICAVAWLMIGSTAITSFANNVQDAEDQLTNLEKEKKELEQKIKDLEKEKGNITTYISKLDNELVQLDAEIDTLNGQIEDTTKSLEETKEELQAAKEQQAEQYDTMKARIKYMYENGSSDYLTMMMEASSFSDLLNRTEYVSKISKYDQGLFSRYDATRVLIEEKEAKLSEELNKLSQLEAKLELEKGAVNTLIASKNEEVKKYEQNISSVQGDVEKYNAEIEEQEALIEQLLEEERRKKEEEERKKREEEERKRKEEEEKKKQEELQNQQKPSGGNSSNGDSSNNGGSSDSSSDTNTSSSMRWPLNISGRITSTFGYRNSPTAGASSYHKGIDIAAAHGTPIVAAADGEVVTARYSSSAGNYIMLYHGNSTYTVYMHNSTLKVSVGDMVKKGEVIAAMGSTGISTGSHLHFGVSVNGSYVDPLKYVRQP